MTSPTETLLQGRCHCEDSQRMHGNFNAFLAAPKGDVLLAGQDALIWYQSSDAARRAFCGTCGARVVKEVTSAGRWLVRAGRIDGPTGKEIIRNLWETSKPEWYDLPEPSTEKAPLVTPYRLASLSAATA